MKRCLVIFAVLALFAGPARAEDLKKLSLDDVSAIGTTIQSDTHVKAEGRSSIKITTQWPTTSVWVRSRDWRSNGKGERPDKVTLNVVINGKGTVWADDIVLSKEPLR